MCLSETKASHSQRMWAEVSSAPPHFLHNGLSTSPNMCRCLLRVLSGKKTNHCPGLSPVEGHEFSLGIQLRSRDKFTRLSLGTIKALPSGPMLVNYPAIEFVLYRSPRDPQGRLRSHKALNRATPPRSHYLVSRHAQGPSRAPRRVG